uniref:CCHC-type domain-containing protein n=1 Tax=Cannabis sativa TaxID=3483 RepID=A0A803QSS6_CANSA
MIIQEERQRSLGSADTIPLAVTTSSLPSNPPRAKKPHPSCSNCGKSGHLVEKCYFLHGFPPGYGDKKRQDKGKAKANHASTSKNDADGHSISSDLSTQCQHLISLSNQTFKTVLLMSILSPWPLAALNLGVKSFSSPFTWILDSGATHHMCST